MGGPALIERPRALPGFQFTPALIFTTKAEETRKQEGRSAGATGWIGEPFDPTRLLLVVNRSLP